MNFWEWEDVIIQAYAENNSKFTFGWVSLLWLWMFYNYTIEPSREQNTGKKDRDGLRWHYFGIVNYLQVQKSFKSLECHPLIKTHIPHLLAMAKLYYTSSWDKFGMNINYFGMHPKTKKKVWDGSQVKAFPNPDHPPLAIFLTYPSFRTKLKNLRLFEVIYQSIWLRWKWKFI